MTKFETITRISPIVLEVGPHIWVQRTPEGGWFRTPESTPAPLIRTPLGRTLIGDGISPECAAGSDEALQYDEIAREMGML